MPVPRILIIAAEDIVVRNVLDTEVMKHLAPALVGASVTLLVPKGRREDLSGQFPGFDVREFSRAQPSRLDALVATLLYAGLPTHTNHWSKMRALLRGDASFFATYAKRIHATTLGRLHPYQRLLRHLFILVGKDRAAQALFDDVRPDLVISLSITNFDTDVVLMREAKRRHIRVVGMTRSWDNLTSHGALRVVPDRIIVQNSFLHDAARGVQGISRRDAAIEIVGLPHYDVYLDSSIRESREEFLQRTGLNPSKKIILYCGMGDFLFKREGDIIDILEEDIEQGVITRDSQVLYSVHPKFRTSLMRASGKKHIVPSAEILYRSSTHQKDSPIRDLVNLIFHADVVVMGASTMAIDAAVLDRPVICIGFDGSAREREIPYWDSVKRFYDSYTHFEELLKAGGVRVASSRVELASCINQYLNDPEIDREGRERIIERFVGQNDGRASERLVRILVDEVKRV
jgi:CDP-glycerol glycerophosphotransferase (TagB/SpsB family)